jgi:hypothetical protein
MRASSFVLKSFSRGSPICTGSGSVGMQGFSQSLHSSSSLSSLSSLTRKGDQSPSSVSRTGSSTWNQHYTVVPRSRRFACVSLIQLGTDDEVNFEVNTFRPSQETGKAWGSHSGNSICVPPMRVSSCALLGGDMARAGVSMCGLWALLVDRIGPRCPVVVLEVWRERVD